MKKVKVSIIIVDYKSRKKVDRLVKSLPRSSDVEIIIIDNTNNNRGYAKACNFGAKQAKGEYLLFSNPDVVFLPQAFNRLISKIKSNPEIGIIGPQLLDKKKKPYLSSTLQPKYGQAFVVYSVLNRWFSKSRLVMNYWYKDFKLDDEREVESISGAIFLISKKLFLKVGGFDERYFMYWEDYDLCQKVIKAGKKIWYYPESKVIHEHGGSGSKTAIGIEEIFKQNRWKFFVYRYGWLKALLLESWLTLLEEWRFALVLGLGAFLRFDRLTYLMPIIPDQGKDYLTAIQALKDRELPLLGIPSSVPRFKQGPLYIWLTMGIFNIMGTDPMYSGLVAAVIGLGAVYVTYLLTLKHGGRLAALIASLIMATSPLAVMQSRLAFHTNPIPLMTGLLLMALLVNTNRRRDWLMVGLTYAMAFQFELALTPLIFLVGYRFWLTRKQGSLRIKSLMTLLGMGIGLLSQIIYDFKHQFNQLGLFFIWLGYRFVSWLGLGTEHGGTLKRTSKVIEVGRYYLFRFWGDPKIMYTSMLVILAIGLYIWGFFKFKQQALITRYSLIWLGVMFVSFIIHGGPSEAYFPGIFIPSAILMGMICLKIPYWSRLAVIAGITIAAIGNSLFLINDDYMVATPKTAARGITPYYGPSLEIQNQIVNYIIKETANENMQIIPLGPGAEYESALDNIKFLLKTKGVEITSKAAIKVYIYNEAIDFKPTILNAKIIDFYGTWVAIQKDNL